MADFNDVISQLKDNKEQNRKSLSNVNKNIAHQSGQLKSVIDGQGQIVSATEEVVKETKNNTKEQKNAKKSLTDGVGNILKNDIGGGIKKLGDTVTGPMKAFASAIPGVSTLGAITKQIAGNAKSGAAAQEAEAKKVKRENESNTLLEGIVNGILDLKDSMLKGLAEKGGLGLGVIAGLIAAPFFALVGFFKSLATEFRFLKALTKQIAGGKFFAPVRFLFNSITRVFQGFMRLYKGMFNVLKMIPGVTKVFDGVGKFFKGATGVFRGIAKGSDLGGFFKTIGKVFVSGIGKIRTVLSSIGKFFGGIQKSSQLFAGFVKSFMGPFKMITGFASKFGAILGKIFLPITILMSAFDFITGFMDGFDEGGILGGLEGGLSKVFANLIGMPLDLLKSAVGWIAGVFGFDGVKETLNSFSFSQLIKDMIGGIFDGIDGVVTFVKDLFTFDDLSFGGIFSKLTDIVFLPLNLAINFVRGLFGWGSEDESEPFRLSTFILGIFGTVKDWVMGIFSWAETSSGEEGTWTLVGAILDAIKGPIRFVKDLFTFDDTSLAGVFSKFIDIVYAPLNLAINFVRGLFGWDTDADGNKTTFSLGDFIAERIASIWNFIKGLFQIDVGSVIKDFIPGWVMKWLPDSLFGSSIPEAEPEARASGGPVRKGNPYLVGERGPELFVPSSSGNIMNANRTNQLLAAGMENGSSGGSSAPIIINQGGTTVNNAKTSTMPLPIPISNRNVAWQGTDF